MRGAGWLHSMLNRLVICGFIWLPSPKINLPWEYDCKSQPIFAKVMGLRAKATAIDVPISSLDVCSAANSNEAGSLEQYRLALIGVARKFKRYPTQAMDRGWTGRVDVRLTIGSNGQMQDVVVRRSSGYGTLDNAALDMVRKGAPLTPLPPALRGREVVIDIPVIFDLQAG